MEIDIDTDPAKRAAAKKKPRRNRTKAVNVDSNGKSSQPRKELSTPKTKVVAVSDRVLGPPAKKPKHRGGGGRQATNIEGVSQQTNDRFSPLPHELLAEIMMFLTTTRDLLAVTRCNKQLFSTFTLQSFNYVWKHVRSQCVPSPLPDPLPIYSEVAYAAYMFDGGNCEICDRWTDNMLASFSLNLRLCNNPECAKTFRSNAKWHIAYADNFVLTEEGAVVDAAQEVQRWFLASESAYIGQPRNPEGWAPNWMCRQSDWTDIITECKRMISQRGGIAAYHERYRVEMMRKERKAKFYGDLYDWSLLHIQTKKLTEKANGDFTTNLAEMEGWQRGDLLNTFHYHNLLRWKNRSLEKIDSRDFQLIRASVDAELLRLQEHRKNKKIEVSRRTRAICVEKFHASISVPQGPTKKPVPPLYTFLRLPAMQVILATAPEDILSHELRNGTLQKVVNDELDKWRDTARKDLAAVLGFPGWESSHANILHPVDRLTARFICKRCDKTLPEQTKDDAYLKYTTACSHECKQPRDPKREWTATWYARDDKAINVILQLLKDMQIKDEDPESLRRFRAPDLYIKCKCCPGVIIMLASSMVWHCHRHENMQFEVVSRKVALAALVHPMGKDVVRSMRGPKAKKKRELKLFGCRHCEQQIPEQQAFTPNIEVPGVPPPATQKQLYTFSGVVGHLKAKHGVPYAHDEDLYFTGTMS